MNKGLIERKLLAYYDAQAEYILPRTERSKAAPARPRIMTAARRRTLVAAVLAICLVGAYLIYAFAVPQKYKAKYVKTEYSYDASDYRQIAAYNTYIFVGKVGAQTGTSYRDGELYTEYQVTPIKNIKGNVATGETLTWKKQGGLNALRTSYTLPENDVIPETDGFYVICSRAEEDGGALYSSGMNSTIPLEEGIDETNLESSAVVAEMVYSCENPKYLGANTVPYSTVRSQYDARTNPVFTAEELDSCEDLAKLLNDAIPGTDYPRPNADILSALAADYNYFFLGAASGSASLVYTEDGRIGVSCKVRVVRGICPPEQKNSAYYIAEDTVTDFVKYASLTQYDDGIELARNDEFPEKGKLYFFVCTAAADGSGLYSYTPYAAYPVNEESTEVISDLLRAYNSARAETPANENPVYKESGSTQTVKVQKPHSGETSEPFVPGESGDERSTEVSAPDESGEESGGEAGDPTEDTEYRIPEEWLDYDPDTLAVYKNEYASTAACSDALFTFILSFHPGYHGDSNSVSGAYKAGYSYVSGDDDHNAVLYCGRGGVILVRRDHLSVKPESVELTAGNLLTLDIPFLNEIIDYVGFDRSKLSVVKAENGFYIAENVNGFDSLIEAIGSRSVYIKTSGNSVYELEFVNRPASSAERRSAISFAEAYDKLMNGECLVPDWNMTKLETDAPVILHGVSLVYETGFEGEDYVYPYYRFYIETEFDPSPVYAYVRAVVTDDSPEVMYLVSKKTETVSGNSSVTTYEYDDSGLLIKKTLVSGNNTATHEYAYNENGATVSDRYKSSAEEYTTMIEYDANGNVIKEYVKENPGSYSVAEYDSEGRKTKLTVYQNGEWMYDVVYTYADGKAILVSEGVNFGKQTGIYDAETKLMLELITEDLHRTKEYDEHGNVVKVVQEKDGITTTQAYSYEYSEDGKMLKKNDPSGTTVYEYDDNGNLLSEITTDETGKESSRIEYEYVSIQIVS